MLEPAHVLNEIRADHRDRDSEQIRAEHRIVLKQHFAIRGVHAEPAALQNITECRADQQTGHNKRKCRNHSSPSLRSFPLVVSTGQNSASCWLRLS